MKQPVQFFNTSVHCYSDVYGSREKTAYKIGRPDGSPMKCFNLSEREAKEILENLPKELVDHVKSFYGVEEEFTEEDIIVVEANEDGEIDLEAMTVVQLRDLCKKLEITGVSKLQKDEIIAKINEVADHEGDDE